MPLSAQQLQVPKEQYLLGKAAGQSWARAAADSQALSAVAQLAEVVRAHPYHDDWLSIGAQVLKVDRDRLEEIHGFWAQVAGTREPPNPFIAGFLSGAHEATAALPA